MRKAHVLLLVTLSLLAAPALAEEIIHPESGLKFVLPRGWTYSQDGDALIATNLNGTVSMIFLVTDIDSSADLLDAISQELGDSIQDAQLTNQPVSQQSHGLTLVHAEGIGICGGEACDWDLTLVTGGRKNLFMVAIGDIATNESAIHRVYDSIRSQ
ncbi:MAG TPA: hypothetical protein VFZ09_10340 [Archangium sp.]|uniref:hypothetical protein n=1 Tax=Archangium sp. TaxID=1872627 RepID=UPI002E3718FF|nr:hypothetical protein [Archangium sp.]HEX5746635.1 hypothetical protein [Archangium sp.]